MNDDNGSTAIQEMLRFFMVLLIWGIWLVLLALWSLLIAAGDVLRSRGTRRVFWVAVGLALVVGGIQLAPLVYGRFALAHSAGHLAQTSYGRSATEIRTSLMRSAFDRGYTDVIQQGEAFSIENFTEDDGILMCVISIDLKQTVKLWRLYDYTYNVKTRVAKPVTPVDFRGKRQEERISIE